MEIKEKIYVTLCAIFSVSIVSGNLIYQKFVELHLFSLYAFELSVGAILYPLTFLITDLITELYGKEKANMCVKLGVCMNIMIVAIIYLMDHLNATPWSPVDNATFHKVFGFYSIAFIGSIIGCYVAQTVDVFLYLWIRERTGSGLLWLRNNGSTAISLLIDTSVVISFMTFFGALPKEHMSALIMNSYLYKLFFTICNTPIFYLSVYSLKGLLARQGTHGLEERRAL